MSSSVFATVNEHMRRGNSSAHFFLRLGLLRYASTLIEFELKHYGT